MVSENKIGGVSQTLKPAQEGDKDLRCFFAMEGENEERHGAVCDTGIYVASEDGEIALKQHNHQRHLETPAFKADLRRIINFLRGGMEHPPLASRQDFNAFCSEHEGESLKGEDINVSFAFGVKIHTEGYSYYLRCMPNVGIINIFAYDNRYLLPELAGQHGLPFRCYSVLPATGKLIMLHRGESGYHVCNADSFTEQEARRKADAKNGDMGVTRAQEEAMLAGGLFGWDKAAAKPWRYDQNGKPRLTPPKNRNEAR